MIGNLAISGFSAIFVVVGLLLVNKGRKQRARSQRIADTETTPIREIRPGTVEIKGVAQPAEGESLVDSPITRTESLATYVEVEEWESSGESGGSWQTKFEDSTTVPILVDDGSGEVQVELTPDGNLNVETTRTKVGAGDEPPEMIQRFLDREDAIGEASRGSIGPLSYGDRRRYSEGTIEPGEEVYVLGTAREERAGWGEREYVIDEPTPSGDFILSDKSESELISEGKRAGLFYLAFGGVFTLFGLVGIVAPWVAG